MSIERIIGILFSGFMCRIYAAGLGLWMACSAASFIGHAFGAISKGFN